MASIKRSIAYAAQMHGVNLGGWLVLEKWITPSLFRGLKAPDEYSLCSELGPAKAKFIDWHRQTFITAADFQWIARQGLDSIRLPVGHWVFGAEPYVESIDYVDFAFEQAAKNSLGILIDLHGAPGSQNGRDHSGRAGSADWHKCELNIDQALSVIEKLAGRYKSNPALAGIELLNEPDWVVPAHILTDYYRRGYQIVRSICGERVKVVFSDGYRHYSWTKLMPRPAYANTAQDVHLYQLFRKDDLSLDFAGHLDKARYQWKRTIRQLQTYNDVMIGEWSLALEPDTPGLANTANAMQAYARAQLAAISTAKAGWFFWTYKTENMPGWSLRDSLIRDWIRF